MFWRVAGFSQPSPLENILDKDDFTLEEARRPGALGPTPAPLGATPWRARLPCGLGGKPCGRAE